MVVASVTNFCKFKNKSINKSLKWYIHVSMWLKLSCLSHMTYRPEYYSTCNYMSIPSPIATGHQMCLFLPKTVSYEIRFKDAQGFASGCFILWLLVWGSSGTISNEWFKLTYLIYYRYWRIKIALTCNVYVALRFNQYLNLNCLVSNSIYRRVIHCLYVHGGIGIYKHYSF